MSSGINPRVRLPERLRKGEVFEIRTVVSHPMESGQRRDADGRLVRRRILNRFTCHFGASLVFEAQLEPAVAANPYISFHMRAEESGVLTFAWTDDDGTVHRLERPITVT
ncbi:MAG: thiosulfate oxidation carrier complex protein SoxZ [Alphaproteobacteria bacterium]|nr:thiosulfate oxidation carrier complex protein SoxZ [Alphaproteobacteria bacterium]